MLCLLYGCSQSRGKQHGKGRFRYHRTSLVGVSPRGGSPDPAAADVGVGNVDVGVSDDDVLADSPPSSPLPGMRGRAHKHPHGTQVQDSITIAADGPPPLAMHAPGRGAAVWSLDRDLPELSRKEARLG